jgi:spermidine/putrescine transport system permease protein
MSAVTANPPEATEARARTGRFRRFQLPTLEAYSVLALLFLFLPVIMLVILSFNSNTTGVFPLKGFTLDWYSKALQNRVIWPALQNSVIVALGTALVSALLGTPTAFGLVRFNFPFKNALRWILTIPMSLPTLLIGVSLLSFLALMSNTRSLGTVIIGHVVYCVPYMVLVVTARLTEFDFTVEEAAQDLGATPWQTFWQITFPLIRPTIVGAMLLIFAQSFDMFVISFFNIGAQSTLPMVIWSMMRIGINPSLNALGTMIMGLSILILILANRFGGIKFGGV